TDSSDNLKATSLGKITAYGHKDSSSTYSSSAGTISRSLLESNPSGNGDITSILRLLPNVQFDNSQLRSTSPGEIDPANISISGGLFWQNNFQLDGFNMNNDLDPHGSTTNNQTSIRSTGSQGLNIDTSLLESITVQDSNVSAAYGGFSGGVVEANVRRARKDDGGFKGWHGNISYQFTQGNADPQKFSLTKYHYDERAESSLFLSADERYQPEFFKYSIKSSLEGHITKDLGLVASFTTTQSIIPLSSYRNLASYRYGNDLDKKRENKRQSYNYYLKAHWNPRENLTLEANLGYAPQYNTYYNDAAANSYYEMRSGGYQAGLKALWQLPKALWTQSLGLSYVENSRKSDANYFYQWFRSVDKNGGGTNLLVFEGGFGDLDQTQATTTYKSDLSFEPLQIHRLSNNIRLGFEISHLYIGRNRPTDHYWMQGNPTRMTTVQHCGVDSLGYDGLCSSSPLLQNGQPMTSGSGAGGQFATQIRINKANNFVFNGLSYGVFAENDMQLDFGFMGLLNIRPGLRFDGDSYMGKHTIAPRFSLSYVTPAPREWQTKLTFGANRYYGRNLLSFWLYAQQSKSWEVWHRRMCDDAANGQANGYTCSSGANAPSDWKRNNDYNLSSFFHFEKLRVPYDDELMGGITQQLGIFELSAKYIMRFGRDEVMRQDTGNAQTRSDSYWNNNGSSQSDIIAVILQNTQPINTFGIAHHYLFAYDVTQVKRSYNIWLNTHNGVDRDDDEYANNELIYYDGALIRYRDRPVENFARPFTLRLTTTHSFKISRTKWLWNNFFRYRGGFDRMINTAQTISINGTNYQRFDKMHFKAAFSWDMRIGMEVDVYRGKKMRNILYVNVDIYNVLNARNMTTLQATGVTTTNGAITPGIASAGAYAVYEMGRQFWFQVGYKF
ncbi:Plug domain-containing protein, partial [Helicobacter sp. MIT 01-3238]|uniref:TonB-dependent receptor plug domain-containing protein n=1 Tax=Helicobacter sp. MIT 01-3238 TaxID=398627 RepID=UPI000E1EA486